MKHDKEMAKLANHLLLTTVAALIVYLVTAPIQAQARNSHRRTLPELADFIAQVSNGDAKALRGVYIPGVLALPVVQQPRGDSEYVSPLGSSLTQFGMAEKMGSVGLLAHNYLAGRSFFDIEPGDMIVLVYGNTRTEIFYVEKIHRYQALADGKYKDLKAQQVLKVGELFKAMYGGERHVTLQTCITRGEDLTWGRLFIVTHTLEGKTAQQPSGVVAAPPPPPDHALPSNLLGWPLNYSSRNSARNGAQAQP